MAREFLVPGDILQDATGMQVQVNHIDSSTEIVYYAILTGTSDPKKTRGAMSLTPFMARFKRIGHGPTPRDVGDGNTHAA